MQTFQLQQHDSRSPAKHAPANEPRSAHPSSDIIQQLRRINPIHSYLAFRSHGIYVIAEFPVMIPPTSPTNPSPELSSHRDRMPTTWCSSWYGPILLMFLLLGKRNLLWNPRTRTFWSFILCTNWTGIQLVGFLTGFLLKEARAHYPDCFLFG